MGFFDTIFNAAVEKGEEIRALKEEYRCYDDDELIRIYKNRSGTKKTVVVSVLRERYSSYSDGELKEIYNRYYDERKGLAASILRERGYH